MIGNWLRLLLHHRSVQHSRSRGSYQPRLEFLEGRELLATLTWVGGSNDNKWSEPKNWANIAQGNQKPAAGDDLEFVGGPNSTMDMGAGFHAKSLYLSGYANTLTLNDDLVVDWMDMRTGTIAGASSKLTITQVPGEGATGFQTSSFKGGTISISSIELHGVQLHPCALLIGSGFAEPTLGADVNIGAWSTLKWQAGNVTVNSGKKITNLYDTSTFDCDAKDKTFGNDAGAANRWFLNNGPGGKSIIVRAGTLANYKVNEGGGKFLKQVSTSGAGETFVMDGDFDSGGGTVEVQDGTLAIIGNYTQSAGGTTVQAGTTLSISGQYNQSGGTTNVYGASGTINTTGQFLVSGGYVELSSGVVISATGIDIQSGGTVEGGGGLTVTADVVTVEGTINPGGAGGLGVITVTGDFTLGSGGVLNMEITYGQDDQLSVSGNLALNGTINILGLNNFEAYMGYTAYLITYSSLGDTTGLVVNTPPTQGTPRYQFDYPNAGQFTFWVILHP